MANSEMVARFCPIIPSTSYQGLHLSINLNFIAFPLLKSSFVFPPGLERTPGTALRTSLLRNRDVRGAPHSASSWCAHGVKVPAVLTPQWYPRGCSTSSWPSLVAPQWYLHRFAVNFCVAEFGGSAVVSPRFCSQLLRG